MTGSTIWTRAAGYGPQFLEQLNDDFEDSLLLVGRVLGDCRDVTAVVVCAVDRHGIDARLTTPGGERDLRLDFAQPLTEVADLTMQAFGLVTRARARSGEAGSTSAERAMAEIAGIRTFVTSVRAVAEVHPHLRRITFGDGDLTSFAPLGPDTFLYVLLPPPGRAELTVDQGFSWDAYQQMPEADRPVGAYYTLRHWRPAEAELDLLFVLHGDGGPASRWAARARPGMPVALWGPREAWNPSARDRLVPAGRRRHGPAGRRRHPRAPARRHHRDGGRRGGGSRRAQDLPQRPGVTVTWCHRHGAAPGTIPLLVDAVQQSPGRRAGPTRGVGARATP